MFNKRNFYILILICSLSIPSILFSEMERLDEPLSPMKIQSMNNKRIHELHQYLINNKSIFINYELLMLHSKYYVLLHEIIKKTDDIISYNQDQPVIDKKLLKEIGLQFENLHFVNYNQLNKQIKDKIIQNKINSLKVK